MHDPKTVAHEIRYPWWKTVRLAPDVKPWRYHPAFITIWHNDPERRGDDDSCDWFHRHLTTAETKAAFDLLDNEIDNLEPYMRHLRRDDQEMVMRAQWRAARRFFHPRPWWRHPKWHIHHWSIQVHPVQHFKRWAWSRCQQCGDRFRWNEATFSDSWHGTGPRWFRSEEGVSHGDCMDRRLGREKTIPANAVAT